MRVANLRLELQQRNLDTTGRKSVLVSRLQLALDAEQIGTMNLDENVVVDNNSTINSHIEHDDRSVEADNNNITNSYIEHDDRSADADNNNTMNSRNENDVTDNMNMSVDETVNSTENLVAANNSTTNSDIEYDDRIVIARDDVNMSVGEIVSAERVTGVIFDEMDMENEATAKKVNFVLMTGERIKSQVLYSKDEAQFYRKNKSLKSGLISYDCAQKHKNKCDRHVYLNPLNDECYHQMPYQPHNHDTQEKLYNNLLALNPAKDNCSKPDVLANTNTKTSVSKAIFMKEIQK